MGEQDKPTYSIVVPVYRSENSLEALCTRILKVFDERGDTVEIVLVDDSSPDHSWKKMQALRAQDERIRIIRLAKNFGQHNALMCAFAHVRGELVITIDDDLQHPPEEIPKLIEAYEQDSEADIVIGAYIHKQHNLIRRLGTHAMNQFSALVLGKDPKLEMTSFRLIRRFLSDEMVSWNLERPRIGRVLLELSSHVINTPVIHDERKYGKSGYSLSRLTKDFISNVLNNSAIPLKLISSLGLCSAVVSFLLGFFYLCRYFFIGTTVAGWTTLVVINLFHFGLILLSVGIIGEYLIRILREGKGLPQYVIRDKEL